VAWPWLPFSMLSRELHLTPALSTSGPVMPVPLSARSPQSIACAVAVFGSPALCLTGSIRVDRAPSRSPLLVPAAIRK
jgi:hypothetical protein